jgi:hypothetical protein
VLEEDSKELWTFLMRATLLYSAVEPERVKEWRTCKISNFTGLRFLQRAGKIDDGFGDSSVFLIDILRARREKQRYLKTATGWIDVNAPALGSFAKAAFFVLAATATGARIIATRIRKRLRLRRSFAALSGAPYGCRLQVWQAVHEEASEARAQVV